MSYQRPLHKGTRVCKVCDVDFTEYKPSEKSKPIFHLCQDCKNQFCDDCWRKFNLHCPFTTCPHCHANLSRFNDDNQFVYPKYEPELGSDEILPYAE